MMACSASMATKQGRSGQEKPDGGGNEEVKEGIKGRRTDKKEQEQKPNWGKAIGEVRVINAEEAKSDVGAIKWRDGKKVE